MKTLYVRQPDRARNEWALVAEDLILALFPTQMQAVDCALELLIDHPGQYAVCVEDDTAYATWKASTPTKPEAGALVTFAPARA